MKPILKSNHRKGLAVALVLLLVISMGASLGYFTASVIAQYNTKAAGINQTAEFVANFDILLDNPAYVYKDISEGEGRNICYNVYNNDTAVATTNKDTITFEFWHGDDEASFLVTPTDLPIQLYWASDVMNVAPGTGGTSEFDTATYYFEPIPGAVPLTPISVDGNKVTYLIEHDCPAYEWRTIDLVVIFNSECPNVELLNGGKVQTSIETAAKIQDRPLSAWVKQNRITSDAYCADDYAELEPVAVVYNTAGDFVGEYPTLKEAFAVAEEVAAVSTFSVRSSGVSIEMLSNYTLTEPITLTTSIPITLTSNTKAMAAVGEEIGFCISNNGFTTMFTIAEGATLHCENLNLYAEESTGEYQNGNIFANYGELYITDCYQLCPGADPGIYNATTGVLYLTDVNIEYGHADLGAAVYSCGVIHISGSNNIVDNWTSNLSGDSNIYLATEEAVIYLDDGYNPNSCIGIASATFGNKTLVYTQDTNRYTSAFAEGLVWERQDILDEENFQVFYYDSEFYLAEPWYYVFNEEAKSYEPSGNGYSPRLGDFAPYILADGTPCDANTHGAYALTHFYDDMINEAPLRELWIPETVTYIGSDTFYNMPDLSRVYWQTTQATINGQSSPLKGNNQLAVLTSELGCTPTNGDQDNTIYFNPAATNIPTNSFRDINLQSVNLSNSSITQISDYAFAWCTKLTSIHLPSELKIIGPYAFKTCSSLTSITVPSKVELVDISAFANCTQLSKVYWNAVNAAGNANSYNIQNYPIFDGCTSLTTLTTADITGAITLSPNVESLPAGFASRTTLQLIDLTDTKISIIPEYFAKGSAAKTVKFSPNTLVIKNYAFDTCIYLENCVLPNTVTSIGNYAFYCNIALPTINIPESVTTVGISCFKSCSKLSKVYWNAVNTSTNVYQTISYPIFGDCPLLTSITTDDIANAIVVSPDVTGFQDGLFCRMPNLTIVNLKNTQLKSIPTSCFYSCTSLIDVLYPETVTSMKQLSFGYCSALSEFTISPNITNVEIRVFEGCTSLSKVYWNAPAATCNSAGSQSLGVFKGCTSLTKVDTVDGNNTIVLATNCTKLPSGMFAGSSITSINLYNTSITAIPDYLCYNCTALTFLKMPNGKTTSATLTSVGTASFIGCTALKSTAIRAESLAVVPTSFADNFTIYYTGDEGTIATVNDTWDIWYCWTSDDVSTSARNTETNWILSSIESSKLCSSSLLDMSNVAYITDNNDVRFITEFDDNFLDGTHVEEIICPPTLATSTFKASVLSGDSTTVHTVTFLAEGFDAFIEDIWNNTSIDTIHYMQDEELLTVTRPAPSCANCGTPAESYELCPDGYCKTCAPQNGCHGYCSKHGGWLSSDFCETCGEHLHCEDSSYISKVTHCASCCTTINLRSWSETYYYPGLYNLCLDCELCLDCCTCENSHIYFRIKLYNSSNSTTSYYSFQAYKNQTWAEFCADPEAQRWTGTEITPVDGYLQDVKSGKWLTVDGRRVLANEAIWDTYASCESMPELLDAWTVKCPGCNLECYIHELCPDGLCAACALDNDCHVYCEECGWSTEFCSWCETCICTSEFTCPNPDIDGCVETSVLCPHCGYCSNCHNDLPILDGSDICIHCSECDIYLDYYNNILENRCYACDRCLDCCNCENTLILFYIDTGANNYGYRAYKNQDFRTWLNSSFAAEYEKSYRFVLSDGGFICEINSGQYLYTNGRLVHADELIWDVVIGDSLYLDDASGCAHCGIVTDMLCPDGYCLDCAADYDIGGWCHGYCEDCGWTEDWCFDCNICYCEHETISCPDGCSLQPNDEVYCHCGFCYYYHDNNNGDLSWYNGDQACDHCDNCGESMFSSAHIDGCWDCGMCIECCTCENTHFTFHIHQNYSDYYGIAYQNQTWAEVLLDPDSEHSEVFALVNGAIQHTPTGKYLAVNGECVHPDTLIWATYAIRESTAFVELIDAVECDACGVHQMHLTPDTMVYNRCAFCDACLDCCACDGRFEFTVKVDNDKYIRFTADSHQTFEEWIDIGMGVSGDYEFMMSAGDTLYELTTRTYLRSNGSYVYVYDSIWDIVMAGLLSLE